MKAKSGAKRTAKGQADPHAEYARRIRKLRTEILHEDRKAFAGRLGVGFTAVAGWERGEYEPKATIYLKLGAIWKCPVKDALWFWERGGLDPKAFRTMAEKMRGARSAGPEKWYEISPNIDVPSDYRGPGPLLFPARMVPNELTTTYALLPSGEAGARNWDDIFPAGVILIDAFERDLQRLNGAFVAVLRSGSLQIGRLGKKKIWKAVTHLVLDDLAAGPDQSDAVGVVANDDTPEAKALVDAFASQFADVRVLGRVIYWTEAAEAPPPPK